MSITKHVIEYTRAPVVNGVIKNVKIVGLNSRNGYRYQVTALEHAKSLYENAPVHMLHGKSRENRKGSRSLDSHFGSLQSIRATDDGLFGDLHVKQSHPMAAFILESDGQRFGLSHNAVVEMNDDETEVTKIVTVNSVDLVDNPATTTTLYEEEEMDLSELVEANKANTAAIAALDEGQGKILQALESLQPQPEPEPKPEPKKRITALETVTEVTEETPAPMGNSHEAFLDAIRGFSTSDMKGAQA